MLVGEISSGSETLYAVHSDHLETPRLLTGPTAEVAWRADYAAFGEAYLDAANTVQLHVRFPGQYFDEETGLHYNRFRYYDPGVGRYISADPIGQVGGVNVYAYALNDPANAMDPSGLFVGTIAKVLARAAGVTAEEAAFMGRLTDGAVGFGNSLAGAAGTGGDLGALAAGLAGFDPCGPAPGLFNAGISGAGALAALTTAKAAAGVGTVAGPAAVTAAGAAVAVVGSAAAGFEGASAVLSAVEATTGFDGRTAIGDAAARAIYGF